MTSGTERFLLPNNFTEPDARRLNPSLDPQQFLPGAGLILEPLHRGLAVADPDYFELSLTVISLNEQAIATAQRVFDPRDQGSTDAQAAGDGVLGEEFAVGVDARDAYFDLGRNARLSSALHSYEDEPNRRQLQ